MKSNIEIAKKFKQAGDIIDKLPLETKEDFKIWREMITVRHTLEWVCGIKPKFYKMDVLKKLLS